MGSKLLSIIREACQLPPERRTEEQINDILEFVKDVKFFTKLNLLQQRTLCRTMTLEQFCPREYIFELGEYGNKFYIVLSGSVGVQVPSPNAPCPAGIHTDKCDCPGRTLETIVFLEKGMGFGELALQTSEPRSATIMATETTEVLVTTKEDYDTYAGQLHRQFIEQRVRFLRQCPGVEENLQLQVFTTQDIIAMANCLNEMSFSGNSIVCRQDELVEHVLFVRSGSLAVMRCVEVEKLPSKSQKEGKGEWAALVPEATENQKEEEQVTIKNQSRAKSLLVMKRDVEAGELQAEPTIEDDEELFRPPKVAIHSPEQAAPPANLATPSASSKEPEKGSGQAAKAWSNIRDAVKLAATMENLIGKVDHSAEESTPAEKVEEQPRSPEKSKKPNGAMTNVEHFKDVQAARKKYLEFETKAMERRIESKRREQIEARKHAAEAAGDRSNRRAKKGATAPLGALRSLFADKVKYPSSAHRGPGRGMTPRSGTQLSPIKPTTPMGTKQTATKLLRIGSLGPFQYYGDQQICIGGKYPVSLVSDPVAEIYMMSKYDILRRLPKKLFASFFKAEEARFPNDAQLLDMQRQTERWDAFRCSIQKDAMGSRFPQIQTPSSRPAGRLQSGRTDVAANLDFLGVTATEALFRDNARRNVELSRHDQELFSQSSAWFLRRVRLFEQDPDLMNSLKKDGARHNLNATVDERNPQAFKLDQYWARVQKDPVAMEFEEIGLDQPIFTTAPLASRRRSVTAIDSIGEWRKYDSNTSKDEDEMSEESMDSDTSADIVRRCSNTSTTSARARVSKQEKSDRTRVGKDGRRSTGVGMQISSQLAQRRQSRKVLPTTFTDKELGEKRLSTDARAGVVRERKNTIRQRSVFFADS